MRDHKEYEALAPGYVLFALEPEERRSFETHLAACDICPREVAEMQAVVEALALAPDDTEPPADLRSRLMEVVRSGPAETAEFLTLQASPSRWNILSRPAFVASFLVALLVGAAVVGFWMSSLQSSLDSSERRVSTGLDAITLMAQADQWWQLEGTEIAPEAEGTLAYSIEQSAASLVAFNLPPASEGNRYHAWVVKGQEPTSIGNMWALGGELWRIVPGSLEGFDELIITLEEEQGHGVPTGPVVATVHLRPE